MPSCARRVPARKAPSAMARSSSKTSGIASASAPASAAARRSKGFQRYYFKGQAPSRAWPFFLVRQGAVGVGFANPQGGIKFVGRKLIFSFDTSRCGSLLSCLYESRFLHQICEAASPSLSSCPPQGPHLRHQQDRAALQGAPRLINRFSRHERPRPSCSK